MRIAIFSEEFKLCASGQASFVSSLVQSLSSLGHEVLVVTVYPNCKTFKLNKSASILTCPSVKHCTDHKFIFDSSKKDVLNSYIQDFNPDIIHLNSISSLDLCALEISKELGIASMFYMYDFYTIPHYLNPLHVYKYFFNQRKILLKILNETNLLCATSTKVIENISHLAPGKEMLICPPAVNTEFFDSNKILPVTIAKIRSKLKINPKDFILMFSASSGNSKLLIEMLKMWNLYFSKNKRFKLLIIGPGLQKTYLLNLIDKLNLKDQVILIGKVKREKMLYFYSISHVLLSNSTREINAMFLLEANSCGLPVFMPCKSPNLFFTQEGLTSFSYSNSEDLAKLIRKFSSFNETEIQIIKNLVRKEALNNKAVTFAKKMVSIYRRAMQIYLTDLEAMGGDFIADVDIFSEEIVDISNYVDETKKQKTKNPKQV